MTIHQAEEYVREYQRVLAAEGRRGGRRSPSLLPASKEDMLRAIKLLVAQLRFIQMDTPEHVGPLTTAAMFIDGFSDMPLDSARYISAMQTRRREINEFHQELQDLLPADRCYWQRVYVLAGIQCVQQKTTFFGNVRSRLGIGPKMLMPEVVWSRGVVEHGRVVID